MRLFRKRDDATKENERINVTLYKEFLRGVSDENLKFVHTSNLWLIAMARLMESQGVDDRPLIDELYRRGRNGFEIKEKQ